MSKKLIKRPNKIIQFLLPFYPIKIFTSIRTLLIIAFLLALRIVFEYVSFYIPEVVLSISFTTLPVLIFGWYFGLAYGAIFGLISNTLAFFITAGHGTVWFWMYAIEEPAMGILAGIFAGWATLRRDNPQVNILIDVVIQQIICIGFGVIAYTVLIMWLSPNVSTHYSSNVYKIYRYLAITLIAIFFILTECFTLYQINAHKTQTWKLITFIYASSLVTISVLIFSFLLGPITTVSYLTYVNGKPPDVWVQIGAVYYLIPRVVVDSIKVPVISVILTSLILMIDPIIKQTKWNIAHQWET